MSKQSMKPAASETNAPRCPYCGYEMTLATEFNKQTGEPSCSYLCCNCYAESPSTEHVRYSLGLEKYEQHKRAAHELAVQRSEMSAVEYLAAEQRMCYDDNIGKRNCFSCPLSSRINPARINCGDYSRQHPEKAIAIVEKWAADHPERSEE
ncbi:MAG: hypothetical protein IKZ82_08290 [Clostridia bacterium]|nr:hypothetical protein [Clostridia bacterium]